MPQRPVPLSAHLNPAFRRSVHGLPIDLSEAIGLTLIVAFGSILSWLCAEHPARLPFWAPWDFSWVEYLSVVLSLWWFLRGIRCSSVEERPPLWRLLSFFLGLLAIYSVPADTFRLHGPARVLFEPRAAHLHAPSGTIFAGPRLAG